VQTLTRGQALRGYTLDAAYAAFQEEWVGSIAVGKRADFVVIDRDILAAPTALDVARTAVLATLVDGECAYCAELLCAELCPSPRPAAAAAAADDGDAAPAEHAHDEL